MGGCRSLADVGFAKPFRSNIHRIRESNVWRGCKRATHRGRRIMPKKRHDPTALRVTSVANDIMKYKA
ncbi:hypothetical protein WN55_09937 [Dufourea novaeangliae]|uniref:Uncharacterized protein n=1 Tax=Dufourea novaeangliae TaxID=178035 RepID=A0A154P7H7_DUFNO|nr:hypothetical protein WN55_09937 [Dufourea novaeangliae]